MFRVFSAIFLWFSSVFTVVQRGKKSLVFWVVFFGFCVNTKEWKIFSASHFLAPGCRLYQKDGIASGLAPLQFGTGISVVYPHHFPEALCGKQTDRNKQKLRKTWPPTEWENAPTSKIGQKYTKNTPKIVYFLVFSMYFCPILRLAVFSYAVGGQVFPKAETHGDK